MWEERGSVPHNKTRMTETENCVRSAADYSEK